MGSGGSIKGRTEDVCVCHSEVGECLCVCVGVCVCVCVCMDGGREGRRVPVQKPEHNVQRCDGVGGKGSHTEDRLEEETGAQGEERRREGSREERRRRERGEAVERAAASVLSH